MMTRIARDSVATDGGTVDGYFEEVIAEIPSRRMATPGDVAVLARFLVSDQAAHVNGVSIPVDGGMIA